MRTVNDFAGKTDNDRIDEAIRNRNGDIVVIPPRVSDIEPERNWWLLDRAILLPENTTSCCKTAASSCRTNVATISSVARTAAWASRIRR